MRNKDTGEFELVVGDKQLLSGFFIGVLLLAVVFAMGYVLGQSSPKSAKVTPETTPATSSSASDSRPPASPSTAAAAAPPEPTAASTPVLNTDPAPGEAPPQPTTVPAKDTSEPVAPPKARPAAEPAAGNYWQLLAGSQTSADAMSQTLRGQGFPVVTRPGINNGLTLVWVGPYTDRESLSRTKKKLEDAGFTNLFRKP